MFVLTVLILGALFLTLVCSVVTQDFDIENDPPWPTVNHDRHRSLLGVGWPDRPASYDLAAPGKILGLVRKLDFRENEPMSQKRRMKFS